MTSNDLGKVSVSILVVNYNAGPLLADCVRTGLEQAEEIVVVDNASSDGSMEALVEQFPLETRLKMVRSERNLGFAAGCNLGAKSTTRSYILFLNPDCVLEPGALQRLVEVLEANPDAGMVGGLLIDPDGTEQGGGRRAVPTPWRSLVRATGLYRFANRCPSLFFDFHLYKQPLPDAPVEVEAISGALMLVWRKAMEDIGSWDEGYFLHCEDLDWCMRYRQKGWRIMFVPNARVVHHKGACSKTQPIFVEWHKHKGMMRFYRKFFRNQYPGILMGIVALGVWLRFGVVATWYSVRKAGIIFGIRRK